jgi:hypothetical protein
MGLLPPFFDTPFVLARRGRRPLCPARPPACILPAPAALRLIKPILKAQHCMLTTPLSTLPVAPMPMPVSTVLAAS